MMGAHEAAVNSVAIKLMTKINQFTSFWIFDPCLYQRKTAEGNSAVQRAEGCGLPDRRSQRGSRGSQLGLVAETLLVAISLHALAALVLADLGLPTMV